MSTIPYQSYSLTTEEPAGEAPRLLPGTLIFVILQVMALTVVGIGPFKSVLLVLAVVFPTLAVSLFQPFTGLAVLYAIVLFDELVVVREQAFTVSKMVAICVALGFFFRCQRREYTLVPPDPISKLALVWGFFCLISSFWALYPRLTFVGGLTQMMLAGILLMASQMINSRARLRTIMVCLSIACVVGAVIMLVFPEVGVMKAEGRTTLGTANANVVARTLVVGVFAGLYLIWTTRSWILRSAMMLAIPIILVGVLATKTRSALASVFVGALGGATLGLRGNITQRLMLFLVLAACSYGGFAFVNKTNILGSDYMERWRHLESGAATRTYIWQTGIKMWLENPALGAGYGMFRYRYTELAVESNRFRSGLERDPHNTWVKTLCELGPVGVSLLFGMIAWLVIFTFRIPPGPEATLGFAITTCTTAVMLFSTLTHLKVFWYSIALIIAMGYTIPRKEGNASGATDLYGEIPLVYNPYEH
jgi:O-antigen ligase